VWWGATVEREVPTALGQGPFIHYELATTDFGTTQRVVEVINRDIGPGTAQAVDGRVIRVLAPEEANSRVAFLGRLESLEVRPTKAVAKVIINPRTGSVVMNQTVTIDSCAWRMVIFRWSSTPSRPSASPTRWPPDER